MLGLETLCSTPIPEGDCVDLVAVLDWFRRYVINIGERFLQGGDGQHSTMRISTGDWRSAGERIDFAGEVGYILRQLFTC